jgi:hypothetical protein
MPNRNYDAQSHARYYQNHKEERRAYAKEYRKNNPIKYKQAIRTSESKKPEYYKKLVKEGGKRIRDAHRELVISHYSKGTNKCRCCGEIIFDFLTIDHIKNDGAQHRKELGLTFKQGNKLKTYAGDRFYNWLIKNEFPKGLQVLCMNCNFSKGKTGTCAHKRRKYAKPSVY